MRPLASTVLLAWLVSLSLAACAATTKVPPKIVMTDVCSVLNAPEAFVNRLIRLRGFVFLGEDHMNVSDKACPGRGIELVIKSGTVFRQSDVHHFYLRMNHQGRRGIATITGLFQSDPSPLTPYVLDIQHVENVVP